MVTSQIGYLALIAVVAIERLAELVVARRNLRWALAQGAREFGLGHYPFMVVLHGGLLVGSAIEAMDRPFVPALGWPMLAVVVAAQALRWWCVFTLGSRWNTRVLVLPGRPLVGDGPYWWLRHPNYLAVAAEGIALPLVHTAWITALTFTLLNAGLLRVRIRVEESAIGWALAHGDAS